MPSCWRPGLQCIFFRGDIVGATTPRFPAGCFSFSLPVVGYHTPAPTPSPPRPQGLTERGWQAACSSVGLGHPTLLEPLSRALATTPQPPSRSPPSGWWHPSQRFLPAPSVLRLSGQSRPSSGRWSYRQAHYYPGCVPNQWLDPPHLSEGT